MTSPWSPTDDNWRDNVPYCCSQQDLIDLTMMVDLGLLTHDEIITWIDHDEIVTIQRILSEFRKD